jgi:hypothetical protein
MTLHKDWWFVLYTLVGHFNDFLVASTYFTLIRALKYKKECHHIQILYSWNFLFGKNYQNMKKYLIDSKCQSTIQNLVFFIKYI